ncbi:hypothetical protein DESA109040_02780 [Deinococcus saxicola]
MPKGRPSPIYEKPGVLKLWSCPLVMTCAMPRPAIYRTSVATIGCNFSRVTNRPFSTPKAPATSTGTIKASTIPSHCALAKAGFRKISGASTPLIAIREPTDRSTPPVAITSVMPIATMMMVATCVRLTLRVCTLRKYGVNSALKISSASRIRMLARTCLRSARKVCQPPPERDGRALEATPLTGAPAARDCPAAGRPAPSRAAVPAR